MLFLDPKFFRLRSDMSVRTDHGTDPTIQIPGHGALLGCCLSMEINKNHLGLVFLFQIG